MLINFHRSDASSILSSLKCVASSFTTCRSVEGEVLQGVDGTRSGIAIQTEGRRINGNVVSNSV